MKNILPLLGIAFSLLTMVACDEGSDTRETTPPYMSPQMDTDSLDFPYSINELIKTDTGVFRGIIFGMPVEKVKVLEDSFALDEETDQYLDYLISYNSEELETAEVIYHLDAKKLVSGIEAVVYPKSKKSQKAIYDQLAGFYTKRYGPAQLVDTDTIRWQSDLDNLTLSMSKVDALKVHDINLVFTPIKPQGVKIGNL